MIHHQIHVKRAPGWADGCGPVVFAQGRGHSVTLPAPSRLASTPRAHSHATSSHATPAPKVTT